MFNNLFKKDSAAVAVEKAVSSTGVTVPDFDTETTREIAFAGLRSWHGNIAEEMHRDLRFPQAYSTYKLMSYDGTISSVLTMLKAIARKAQYEFEYPEHVPTYQRKFLDSILDDMDDSWANIVAEMLHGMMVYGFNISEIVYKQRLGFVSQRSKRSLHNDGRIAPAKLATRGQNTIEQWLWDKDNNELLGIKQRTDTTNGTTVKGTPTVLQRDKFLHLKHDAEKGNPEGKSILRGCWQSWTYKKTLEEILAASISRDLAGIPLMHVPAQYMSQNATEEQKAFYEYAKLVVRNIQRNEQAGIILPSFLDESGQDQFKFELVKGGGSGQSKDINETIRMLDNRILLTFLADVMLMGGDNVGSYSLASSKENTVLKMVNLLTDELLSEFNKTLIPELWRLNGFDMTQGSLPKLKVKDYEQDSLDELGKFVQRVVSVGAMELDKPLSDYLRDKLEVAPADAEQPLDPALTTTDSDAGELSRESVGTDNSTNNNDNAS